MDVNGKDYEVIRLLGKGKGGYSYLVTDGKAQFVLKQIHHEPCDYYSFGNKIEAEQFDYGRLSDTGIRIPRMLDIDIPNERIVKEYIDGPTVMELVNQAPLSENIIDQAREMAEKAKKSGLNIDYYPTNFVVRDVLIYYIDYECNPYDERWNFESWGIQYWIKNK